jgi:hypothetical protein
MAAYLVRAQADELAPECRHGPAVWTVKTHYEIERRGLTGAVGADQGQRLIFANGKAHVLDRLQAAEALVEVSDNQCISHDVSDSLA